MSTASTKTARVKTALVVGGTGHIGSAVARELVTAGWSVTVMTRRPSGSRNLADIPVAWHTGDGHDGTDLRAAARGMDLVVDAAAPYPVHPATPRVASEAQPVEFAVGRTRALVAACDASGAALVAIGSFVTHRLRARSPHRRVRLQSRLLRRMHPYFAVKAAVEAELCAAASRGAPIGIVNPTGCLGPWNLKPRGLCLIPMIASGDLPASTPDIVDFIDVRDVAIAVRRVAETKHYGEPVLLAGHSMTFSRYFHLIASAAGRKAPAMALPASLGVAALWAAERALAPFARRPPWPSLSMFIVAECGDVPRSAAQALLGVHPRPVADTVADALAWYRSLGYC